MFAFKLLSSELNEHLLAMTASEHMNGFTPNLHFLTGQSLHGVLKQICWIWESTPPARDFTDFYQQDAEDGVQLMKILGFSKCCLIISNMIHTGCLCFFLLNFSSSALRNSVDM